MSATLRVISRRVGVGGQTHGIEALRIQQLLCRAAMLDESDISSIWSSAATDALKDFQAYCKVPEPARMPYILPSDSFRLLIRLCEGAGVLLPAPVGRTRAAAFLEFFGASSRTNVPYGWSGAGSANRMAFGLDGNPGYIVFTTNSKQFDLGDVPIAMNCTSFSNLAMSIWLRGNAHAAPYDSSQNSGGFVGLGTRYGLDYLVNPNAASSGDAKTVTASAHLTADDCNTYFYSAEDVLALTKPGELYYLQWCRKPSGFGHHDTVLLDGYVYETNIPRPALRKTRLAQRLAHTRDALRLMGPL